MTAIQRLIWVLKHDLHRTDIVNISSIQSFGETFAVEGDHSAFFWRDQTQHEFGNRRLTRTRLTHESERFTNAKRQ